MILKPDKNPARETSEAGLKKEEFSDRIKKIRRVIRDEEKDISGARELLEDLESEVEESGFNFNTVEVNGIEDPPEEILTFYGDIVKQRESEQQALITGEEIIEDIKEEAEVDNLSKLNKEELIVYLKGYSKKE